MNRLHSLMSSPALILLLCVPASFAAAEQLQDVGSIDFPTSESGPAQQHFLRGVATLHSFGWKQSITEFQAAQALDADFAMAYWGESLCYNHPLLREMDLDTPQAVLNRLAPTFEERLAKAPTAREKDFITAVQALFFGDGDTASRRLAYMEVMQTMHAAYPDDDEVAAFYALSLLSAAGPAGGEGHRLNVRAGAIGMDITSRNPDHPGALHYTIHAFDDPVHAPLALPAALRFDDVAPAVSHARHMPTHIFIQHGMWQQVSDSNQSAYDAAVALWVPGDSAGDMTHALDWGQYGDLQLGDYERAQLWIRRMQGIVERNPNQPRVIGALPRVKARYVVETGQWAMLPVTENSTAVELFATGLSAVELGKLAQAKQAEARLAQMVSAIETDDDSAYYSRTSQPLRIMHLQVAGMLAIAEKRSEKGLAMLQESVEIAESMRPPNGAPNPIKPAHELYGQALLDAGRAEPAAELFATSLLRTPNRPQSLLGLARASNAIGDTEMARRQYAKLLLVRQNPSFPEVREASDYLTASADD